MIGRSPRPKARLLVVLGGLALAAAVPAVAAAPPDPATFAGHPIGADRKLVRWPKIVEYFELLARETDRLRVAELGTTTRGNRLIAGVISSASNLADVDAYRDIALRLASGREVDETLARALAARGKVIVAITLNLHSTEIASSQMALELAWRLATDDSPAIRASLADTIVLLIPSLNPDGQIMVCEWYDRYLGTEFEGGRLPWLYHPYAGHDNNRDWFMLNLLETRLVTRFLYGTWHPQAILDQHQMGNRGARLFVPPYFDPVNPNVHPLVWRQIAVAGAEIATRLEEQACAGVLSSATYDGWRPGDMDTTPWWHNVVGLITEAASVRIATPIVQTREELRGNARGLDVYRQQMNFPTPWPGGTWRLRDIVDYELVAALGFIESCARHKTDLLLNSWRMNRDAIERGRTDPPFAFVVPAQRNDPWTVRVLIDTLLFAGVEVHRAPQAFRANGVEYGPGSYVLLLAQPLRPYVKDLLEAQRYPDRRLTANGQPEPPYDEAGWTLPLKMGVHVEAIERRFETPLERIESVAPATGRVIGASQNRFLAFSGASHAATIAVNRLLGSGAEIRRTEVPLTVAGVSLPTGSVTLASARGMAPKDIAIIEELGITAYRVERMLPGVPLRAPRVALYQPWGGNADEGWTRLVLERFEFPFATVHKDDIRGGGLAKRFDAIIIPSMSTNEILTGESSPTAKPTLPPPYAGGLGPDGVQELLAFVKAGGTLVTIDRAALFAIRHLGLPVKNVLDGLGPEQFFCPGSLLKVAVDQAHPLAAGLPAVAHVFFNGSPAFEVAADGNPRPTVVASYPDGPLLESGWILGEAALAKRAAIVDAPLGRGRVVLVGFRPTFRAQTYGTYRVLFNALYASTATATSPALARDPETQTWDPASAGFPESR
jgi:hypothetical protein